MNMEKRWYVIGRPKENKVVTWLKNIGLCAGILLMAALVVFGIYFVTLAQFEVYKKKHGQHMTWFDFILDSERK